MPEPSFEASPYLRAHAPNPWKSTNTHITCVTADAARNLDFYTRVLGLRLVKKTVNQDDPGVYHLFYADEAGSPGADITFFEFPGAWQGSAGAGMVHTIVWRVSSADAVAFWASRLRAEGVEVAERDDSVAFRDPDGLNHELVVSRADDERLVATHAEIDPAFALEGFDGVRAYAVEPEASSSVLAGILGFEATPDPDVWRLAGPTRSGLYASDAAPAAPGRSGPGTVHHVAFTTPGGGSAGLARTAERRRRQSFVSHRSVLVQVDLLPRAERRAVRTRDERPWLHGR